MATTIEAQGRTIDEAIQIALNQLGVSRDKVEIDIVHHPRRGILGIGARRAKVRATLRANVMPDGEEYDMSGGAGLEEKPRRRRRRGGRNRGGGRDADKTDRTEKEGAPQRPAPGGRERPEGDRRRGEQRPSGDGESQRSRGDGERRSGRGRGDQRRDSQGRGDQQQRGGDRGRDRQRQGQPERGEQRQEPERPDRQDRPDRPERTDRPDKRERDQRQRSAEPARATPPPAQPAEAPTPEPPVGRDDDERSAPEAEMRLDAASLEPIRARAEALVRELLAKMGFAAEISSQVDEAAGEAIVSVRSDNEGLLIGRRGQTLDALEHIVNRMALRGDAYGEGRILLDIGDYRRRRRESLEELAGRLRTRAVGERRTVQVSPMSPRDRRYFIQAFGNDDAVDVRALGAGFYRRVVVAPAGASASAFATAETEDADDDATVSAALDAE